MVDKNELDAIRAQLDAIEYWTRFIIPQIERASQMGYDDDQIKRMLQRALDDSDFESTFPAMLFRDMIDGRYTS